MFLRCHFLVQCSFYTYFRVDKGRIKLKTIGPTCQVEVQNAQEKDSGVWDFYVGIGDDFFNRKHVFYTVYVRGNTNVLGLSWFLAFSYANRLMFAVLILIWIYPRNGFNDCKNSHYYYKICNGSCIWCKVLHSKSWVNCIRKNDKNDALHHIDHKEKTKAYEATTSS